MVGSSGRFDSANDPVFKTSTLEEFLESRLKHLAVIAGLSLCGSSSGINEDNVSRVNCATCLDILMKLRG